MLKPNLFNPLSLGFAVLAIFGPGCLSAAETVEVGSTAGLPGESIVLPVEIKPSNPIVGVQFTIRYAPGQVVCGAPGVASSDSDHVARSDDNRRGRRSVVIFSPTNEILPENLSLNLPLTLTGSSPDGGPSVSLEGMIFTDAGGGVYTDNTRYTMVEEWRRQNFTRAELLSDGVVGDNDDPDGDGVPNLLELASGTEPTRPDGQVRQFVLAVDESGQTFLKVKFWRAASSTSLVDVSGEVSEDLRLWSGQNVVETSTGRSDLRGEEVEFRVPVDEKAHRQRYLRLRASRKSE